MNKINMRKPIVVMDGDEMAQRMWEIVRMSLLNPFIHLKTERFDLSLQNRDRTGDLITIEAANAVKKHFVGVKCATITPDATRISEYNLKNHQLRSPNGTIRGLLDGTIFRVPIIVENVRPSVRSWTAPIHIARHANADVYSGQEIRVDKPGRAKLIFTPADGEKPINMVIQDFTGSGILQAIYNTDASIVSFARACFRYAYELKISVLFATKDTVSKIYDANFRDIFQKEYEAKWKVLFDAAGLTYTYTLIDDAVSRVMRSTGGFLWCCKNYDGDVESDMIASAYGSLALMSSVLMSPNGQCMFEAAHGTVRNHYYKYLAGEKTSTNPTAIIFAWTGALRKRGELDGTPELVEFAELLERATLDTIESGVMTGDLIKVAESNPANRQVTTEEFIAAVKDRLNTLRMID